MKKTYEMNNERTLLVNKVKRMLNAGYSVKEICEKLEIPESTVRSYKNEIDK